MSFRIIALTGLIILGGTLRAHAEERSYDLSGFEEVSVHSGVTVDITVGADFDVTAEARRGKLDRLILEVSGDRLKIERRANWGLFGRGKRDRFFVTISMPALTQAISTSGSSMTVATAQGDLDLSASSGSSLRVEGGALGAVEADATSGSTLVLSGTCEALEAEASSGSSLRAQDMVCADVDGRSTSGSSLRLHGTETAKLRASSGSSLRLEGGAEVLSRESSSGSSIRVD